MSSKLDLFLYLLMALAFGGAVWMGRGWPVEARIFPFLISGAGLLLVAVGLLIKIFKEPVKKATVEEKSPSIWKELATFAWISGYFIAVALFGFQWGLSAIIFAYLKAEADLKVVSSLLFAALCWAFIYVMQAYLYIPLYEGWLTALIGLA
jgi:hypothetical protein